MITNKEVRISVSKILSKKLMTFIAVIAVLAMMIPTAIPVSAAPSISKYLVNPVTGTETEVDYGYNIYGSHIVVSSNDSSVVWSLENNSADAQIIGTQAYTRAEITGDQGEVSIVANATGPDSNTNKKWDLIGSTVIDGSGSSTLTWNQTDPGYFYAEGSVTDKVLGTALYNNHALQGAILNWYLLAATWRFLPTP